MRISDWSSDVCSSDLSIANAANLALLDSGNRRVRLTVYNTAGGAAAAAQRALAEGNRLFLGPLLAPDVRAIQGMSRARSEEHTSELQSLMRISYAVFCLKKKKKK